MKILLIKPFIKYEARGNEVPPLGLAYIGAVLEKAGHTVKILDRLTLKQSLDDFRAYLQQFSPDIVGITCMTPEYSAAIQDMLTVAEQLPDAIIIFGGNHPTLFPEDMLKDHSEIDYIVIGEGEVTFQELVAAIETQSNNLETIKGIAFREDAERIIITPPREFVKDLDSLPLPAYHLLPMDKYMFYHPKIEGRKYVMLITSRGCPYKCSFCAHPVFGRKVRYRSIETVMKEIDFLVYRFGVHTLTFVDDTFITKQDRIVRLCNEIIQRDYELLWSCVTNLHTVNRETLLKMREAGCIRISYGVESADPIVLNAIHKSRRPGLTEEVFQMTREAGIESFAYFMLGLPGETKKTLRLNKKLIKTIQPDYIQFTVLTPFPGSEIFERHKDHLPHQWARYQMANTKQRPLIQLGELDFNEQLKAVRSMYRWFYLNPKFILKRLRKDIQNFQDLLFFIRKASLMVRNWF